MQDAFRVSFVIVAIYVAWVGVSFLLFGAGKGLPSDGLPPGVLVAPAVFFHICLAALATAFFMVYAMEPLRPRHRLRAGFIGFSILLTGIIYALSRQVDPGTHLLLQFLKMLNTANLIVFANLLGSWITAPPEKAGGTGSSLRSDGACRFFQCVQGSEPGDYRKPDGLL